MDPNENGYLARHLQNPFYYNFYNTTIFPQFSYNYSHPNQFLVAQPPISIPEQQINEKLDGVKLGSMPNQKSTKIAKKKKRFKGLVPIDIRREIRKTSKTYKSLRKSLPYFDTSRAPPITTLRSSLELQIDLNEQLMSLSPIKNQAVSSISNHQKTLIKLQISTQDPDEWNYPFLICKRRKYYRNFKRRYSVSYFEKRAYYIQNKIPIPFELEPKYKNRRNRLKRKPQNNDEDDDSLSDSYSQDVISSEFCDPIAESQKDQIQSIPNCSQNVSEPLEQLIIQGQN